MSTKALVNYTPAPVAANPDSAQDYIQKELQKIRASIAALITAVQQLQAIVSP